MPEKGVNDTVIFKEKSTHTPNVVIYADFESLQMKTENETEKTKNRKNEHIASCYCFFVKSKNEGVYQSKKFSFGKKKENQDIGAIFVNSLLTEIIKVQEKFKNEGYKIPEMTPVFFHNLSGYDSHLFILQLAKIRSCNIQVLPSNSEKYISFSIFTTINGKRHEIRFLDSYKFLKASLKKLVEDSEHENLKLTKIFFPNIPLSILAGKGVYPYEWVNNLEKLKASSLPPIECFYSSLEKKGITQEDYKHALKAWSAFECKTMFDYQLKYCELDVLLLADVYETFRKTNIQAYGLDPVIYGFTTPGLSWNNMLKFTGQEIELITDQDTYRDFENGIRGGISLCNIRHAKANNKYLKDYDPSQPSTYFLYIDKNNLYGEAMSEEMPYGIERNLKKSEFSNWRNLPCAVVCDLEIPEVHHDFFNSYPPAPVHLEIKGVKKLVPNLENKKAYLCYSELLKFYETLGVKVVKIYRGYIFKMSRWLEPYITNNTNKRAETEKTSEQDFYKSCNNSIYGKTIENPRKRSSVTIVNSEQQAEKKIKSPEFTGYTIFSPDLVAVNRKKTVVECTKPIYIGFVVLELSKLKMYQLYYSYLLPKFENRLKLMYTDTDSFFLHIESPDIYEEMKTELSVCFDTSKYPKNHPWYSIENKNRLGFFKDEAKGKIIKEFCGICAKSYSYTIEEEGETKENIKCKGVKSSCIEQKEINHEDYLNCIFKNEQKKIKYCNILTDKHGLYTIETEKIALEPTQDVRILAKDGIHTFARGHHSLKHIEDEI